MAKVKEMDYWDEYISLPTTGVDRQKDPQTGYTMLTIDYPNPKIGKIYRNPDINPTVSRTITVTKIIGITHHPEQPFKYAYPKSIKILHTLEIRIYVKVEKPTNKWSDNG